jgi:hypothetical protein
MRNARKASGIPTVKEVGSEWEELIRRYAVPEEEPARHDILHGIVSVALENDRRRRHRLCMAGLDVLVSMGGLPWGVRFGYERTARPGFPAIHPAQAKAVKRAFRLGMNLSAGRTARVLEKEGHPSPNGTVHWTAQMVQSIWDCVTYTGRIQYRKTQTARDRSTGKHIKRLRPPESQIVGYNPSLQIVNDGEFAALGRARRRRQCKRT